MQSPHGEVQKFALRKMGAFSTPATVRALVEQLGDPDYRRRDVAASSLRKIPEARAALIKELLTCDDASKAWSIAELLPSFEGKWRQDTLELLWKRLQAALAAEERIQTAFCTCSSKRMRITLVISWPPRARGSSKPRNTRKQWHFSTPLKDFSRNRAGE